MKDCKRKKKCLFGPNVGVAYDPADPCCGGGEFNSDTCDCEILANYARWTGVTVLNGVITPSQSPWISVNTEIGQSLALVGAGAQDCDDVPEVWTFCNSPSLSTVMPWNDEVTMERGPQSCIGGGSGALIYRYFPDDDEWRFVPNTIVSGGLSCSQPEGTTRTASGDWEYFVGEAADLPA